EVAVGVAGVTAPPRRQFGEGRPEDPQEGQRGDGAEAHGRRGREHYANACGKSGAHEHLSATAGRGRPPLVRSPSAETHARGKHTKRVRQGGKRVPDGEPVRKVGARAVSPAGGQDAGGERV